MEKVKIAICQKNFTVGDLEKNYRTIIDSRSYCQSKGCLLYTSPSPRDGLRARMPSSA
mgnify:CR=1 FL=1